jgi:hypothetical protein
MNGKALSMAAVVTLTALSSQPGFYILAHRFRLLNTTLCWYWGPLLLSFAALGAAVVFAGLYGQGLRAGDRA